MSTPEPPVTADHTPERLSAEEREAAHSFHAPTGRGPSPEKCRMCAWYVIPAVERVLTSHAAHLADVEARLAAVEALADEWAADPDGLPRADVCARKLRAALHPDPSE